MSGGRAIRGWVYPAVVAVLVAAALAATFAVLKPTPPRVVVISTGPPGSAYHEFAERYRELFAEQGIELVLRESAGAGENLRRLLDPDDDVEVGFVSMGLATPDDEAPIRSLGAMFFEPVWVFYTNQAMDGTVPSALQGRRIGVGLPGGLAHLAALRLMERLEVSTTDNEVLNLAPEDAAQLLQRGDIDLAFFASAAGTPVIQELLASEDVELVDFLQADAYVARFPGLTKLVVPAGVGSFARRRPPQDATILAFTGALFVRESLHPAIQSLLLDAATTVHGVPDMFHTVGRFPRPEALNVPLSDSADQFYRSGRPFLQRYLPFWMAVLVKQLLAIALPLVGILYPVLRVLPSAFGWAVRRRITRLYGELRLIELEAAGADDAQHRARLSDELESLEQRVRRLRVPESYAPLVYHLRVHIGVIRGRFVESRP